MESRAVLTTDTVVPKEKSYWKSIFYPQFDSSSNEKKFILSYFKKIYPARHRLLVLTLISHSLINSIQILIIKRKDFSLSIWMELSLFFLTICLNLFSLILIARLKNRLLSNLISLICLSPLIILSCIDPLKCHVYFLMILLYTLSNFPLILSLIISLATILFLTLSNFIFGTTKFDLLSLLLLLISNLIGTYLNRLLDLTMCSAFNQLCKNSVARGSLLAEHTLISKMIDSLMPPKYAKVIMEDFDVFRERVQNLNVTGPSNEDDLQMTVFRPLHIERMENVSILFADIVGFTQMSSNKTASQLVALLSDLYGRFDDLCVQMSCEKIATLGDCYYCVSGCPEKREDHAKCCVQMGLSMIKAIEEFDQDNCEQVDMRVGVHSGSVNCGIVGTKKFKFDIFSNDVTLANKMESTGKPGFVHITESTYQELNKNEYHFEEGEPYLTLNQGSIKTYFIGKQQFDHRITRKPPQMTLATAAAVAIASSAPLSIPLNETDNLNKNSLETTVTVTSPLLEEVERVRRSTLSEEEIIRNENQKDFQQRNKLTIDNEEKEFDCASNRLTLFYKEKRLEKGYSEHIGPYPLLIIEVLLLLICLLLIYIYLPKTGLSSSISLSILILIQLILTLILIRFYAILLRQSLIRHVIATIFLISPFILIISIENLSQTLSLMVIYLSSYLTIGASVSHFLKVSLGLISISIFFPLNLVQKNPTEKSIVIDMITCFIVSIILLYFLTRQIEKARRFQFHVVKISSEQGNEIEKERKRADWLLRNILPEHVIEPLRLHGGTYSKDHHCVGVLFASLTNFHVMYEEQYEGGKFYARILNEFYGDIEELFLDRRFSKIEKIKTIGSTFMAASGLQTEPDDPNALDAIYDLMEFALAFQSTMYRFNEALLNFEFELRMGFNYGPVTAGVIGTTKLFYDIWGDTVNVASRMDSTGEKGKIQVPEKVALALENKYRFEFRGEIGVKGKSRMKTYFLKQKQN